MLHNLSTHQLLSEDLPDISTYTSKQPSHCLQPGIASCSTTCQPTSCSLKIYHSSPPTPVSSQATVCNPVQQDAPQHVNPPAALWRSTRLYPPTPVSSQATVCNPVQQDAPQPFNPPAALWRSTRLYPPTPVSSQATVCNPVQQDAPQPVNPPAALWRSNRHLHLHQ